MDAMHLLALQALRFVMVEEAELDQPHFRWVQTDLHRRETIHLQRRVRRRMAGR